MWHVSAEGFCQFSVFDNRIKKGVQRSAGFASPCTWLELCCTATINTVILTVTLKLTHHTSTEPNIPPYLLATSYLPTSLWLLSAVWGSTKPTECPGLPYFGASSYTWWPKKWVDCVWLATSLKGVNQFASLLAYFNIVLHPNTATEVTWLHDSEQVRRSSDSNKE